MSEIWLPGDSDFALAMREPNLLMPGVHPSRNVKINESHPLAPDIFVDLANGSAIIKSPRYQGITVSVTGTVIFNHLGAWFDGSSAINLTGVPAFGTGNFSVVFRATTDKSSGYADYGTYFGRGTTATGSYMIRTWKTSDNLRSYGSYETSVALETQGSTIVDLKDTLIAGSRIWSIYTDYTDGAISDVDTSASYPQTITDFQIGCASSEAHRFFKGYIKYLAIYIGRGLSDNLISALKRDEYQYLTSANDSPHLISVPAGGGVPTLSLPGVSGVQATQATPQVTLTF